MVPVECASHAGHQKCITEWVKLVGGDGADIRTSGRACRGTVEVAEAAYLAVEERRVVTLPIDPHPWVASGGEVDAGGSSEGSYHIEM